MRRLNLRGRYEGGGYVVTARHWWSRKERESARIAARIIAYDVATYRPSLRAHAVSAMIYGRDYVTVYKADA